MGLPKAIGRFELKHAIQSSRAPSLGRDLGIIYRRREILSAGLKLTIFWKIILPIQHVENVSPVDLSAMCGSTNPILLCYHGVVSANAHRGACLAQSIAIRYTVTQLRRAFQESGS